MSKVTIKGVESALLSKVRESINPINAVMEFIDNSIDAGATNISITYRNNKLSIKDNGCGMSKTAIKKWCSEITTHISNGIKNIGIKGVGSKYAMMTLANLDDYNSSKVEIKTFKKNSEPQHIVWLIELGKKFEIVQVNPDIANFGTEIIINDCVNLDEQQLVYAIGHQYSNIPNKVSIKFNNKLIKFEDNCHLNLLGNDINVDGNYIKDGIVFGVRTIKAINEKTNDEINLKIVGITISQNASDNKYKPTRKNCRDGGVYVLYNNRYINYGDNTTRMFNQGNSDRAGKGNIRVLLILNDENQHPFSINSDKNLGIKPLFENQKLRNYVVNNKTNLYNFIEEINKKAYSIISYETKKTNGDKNLRNEITQVVVDALYDKKQVKNSTIKKLPVTTDYLDLVLENFENEDYFVKNKFYGLYNICIKNNIKDEKALNIVKDYWNFYVKSKTNAVCQSIR